MRTVRSGVRRAVGATHVPLVATDSGLTTPAEHIAVLERFAGGRGAATVRSRGSHG
jgi:hypothetical protein